MLHYISKTTVCNVFDTLCNIPNILSPGRIVILRHKRKPKTIIMKKTFLMALLVILTAIGVRAQDITVHGTVLSASDNEPLIGVSIVSSAKDGAPAAGATTDIDGNFTIKVPAGAQLTISYIGFKSQTVKAASEITIMLEENSELLDEVVVVGYSAEKKADLTGSVSVVKMKDVADTPTGNVIQSLQGRVAGMNITTDGTPVASAPGTSIRGASSFRGEANGPLYVIDGIMTRENPAPSSTATT